MPGYHLRTIFSVLFFAFFFSGGCSDNPTDNIESTSPPRSERIERGLAGRLIRFQGEKISGIVIPSLNGNPIDPVKRADGRVVLINFWASWCPPCVEEIPSLSRLHRDMKDRGLEIYGVNMKESAKEIAIFRHNHNIEFPILLDLNGILMEQWGYETLPTTVILDGEGKMRFLAMGYIDWDDTGVRRQIESLLNERTENGFR